MADGVNNIFSGKVPLDDSEPLELHKHAPTQIEDVDLRINILKEYISKSPNATLKDLKKSLDGVSKFTDSEFMNILKAANLDKYNELKPLLQSKPTTLKSFGITKKMLKEWEKPNLPNVDVISSDNIKSGENYNRDEINFLIKYSSFKPKHIFILYKQAFPNSERNPQFITDFRYHIKKHPDTYIRKIDLVKPQPVVSHQQTTQHVIHLTDQQLATKTIRSLYKAGYTPDTLPKVKLVINELLSQNSDYAEIELAIEYLKP